MMGCASSMKVLPTSEAGKNDDSDSSDKNKPKTNGVSNGNNKIRADRVSLANARARREEEIRNRQRRLSSLQPEEVDRVRRNSSHLSSHSSIKVGNSFNPLPEEENIAEVRSSKTSIKQKQKKKTKKKPLRVHSPSDTSSNDDGPGSPRVAKIFNENSPDNNSTTVVEFNPLELSTGKSENPPPLIEKERQNTSPRLKRTTHSPDDHNITISPFSPELHEEKHSDVLNTRQSIDSVKLKTDANHFVNSIMTQALQKMENKNDNNELQETANSDNNKKPRDLDTVSVTSSIVDDQAKGLVGNVLNNALFIVSSDKK